jgi:rod shape-determining protein MreC
MYSLRRWWGFYGSKVILAGVALGSAWFLRQTQGALLVELYYQATRPFQAEAPQMEILQEAASIEMQERLLELESQNAQLKKLLGEKSFNGSQPIFAPIVGRSADQWWQQTLLGRGQNQGMAVGSIVTAPGGLVGRITQVTPNTSRVLLVTDASSSVGLMISRSRAQAYGRGQGTNQMIMHFFDKDPDVRTGDVVTTSSISTLFPGGIPVGVVESVTLKTSPTPQAVVRLTAPINRLEWVQVIPFQPPVQKLPALKPVEDLTP